MKTIKTMMKTLLALILLLAVAPCALPAYAEEALPPLSGLSLYEPDAEEDTAILATEPPRKAEPASWPISSCGRPCTTKNMPIWW